MSHGRRRGSAPRSRPSRRAALLLLVIRTGATPAPPLYPDSNLQCGPSWQKQNWPTFHLLNNVTKRPNGELDMEELNDANAIFRCVFVLRFLITGLRQQKDHSLAGTRGSGT